MLHVGLDLSRKRVDVCLISSDGELVEHFRAPADRDGLYGLTRRVAVYREPVRGVIESMNGARFVHDELVRFGWEVLVADAQRVKGLAPLACKTDQVDARVLAELSFRDLVPPIWLPSPELRAERERSRWRLHLVKHRATLKNRVHSSLIAFGHQVPIADLFGVAGRKLLAGLDLPEPWRAGDRLGHRVHDRLRDRRAQPVLLAREADRVHGLCPRVSQSGEIDRRGPLSMHGPRYLRGGLMEAAIAPSSHPLYKQRYQRTKRRLGRQRGPKVAQIELARKLTEATWYMPGGGEDRVSDRGYGCGGAAAAAPALVLGGEIRAFGSGRGN